MSVLAPVAHATWNSALPFSSNDGTLWAGRGMNTVVTAGVRAQLGPVTLHLAPQHVFQENRSFQTIAYSQDRLPRRSVFASPWHHPPESLDLPQRFGDRPIHSLEPGQSSVSWTAGAVAVGVATENLWWGPGIRNALVMSNNAAGTPHVFVRSAAPVRTRLGAVSARWILGQLRESDFFDHDPTNDTRSLSGLALELAPRAEPNLSLGLTRVVYAPVDGRVGVWNALDVFRNVGRPNAAPRDRPVEPGPDQVFSLFGRWVFPESGFETYAEWARFEQPASLRDLLVAPHHTQGYTVGLQWARPAGAASTLRLQAEATNLELSSTYRYRPMVGSYSSRAVAQGYTHRGQVIGAAIGPGASSQWLAADYHAPSWQLGFFGGRVRWDNTAFYTTYREPSYLTHDVSIFGGVRGAVQLGPSVLAAEFTTGTRLNYLFQADVRGIDDIDGVDIRNHTLQVTLSTAARLP